MPVFPRRFEQYNHAEISLNRFVDEYENKSEWKLTYYVRKDVMQRARTGLKVRKKVHVKRVKDMEVTSMQVNGILVCMNSKQPYNQMSFDILKAMNELVGSFNSGTVALLAFGPSEKPYEKGKHEQSIKQKLRRLERENLIELNKKKYYKLPVWDKFYQALMELKDGGITIRQPGDDIF